MEGTDAPVSEESVLKKIDEVLEASMKEFEKACRRHIPFVLSSAGSIKYIPERCIVTYFSWGLINNGYTVFNEQTVNCGARAQRTQRFDLLARKFEPEGGCVQIKVEAKGNLDGGYKEILADIERMEDFTVAPLDLKFSNAEKNWEDDRFPYRFNIILTQNWGLMELSRWWTSAEDTAPKNERGGGLRRAEEWVKLKKRLLMAESRGVLTLLKSAPDAPSPYTIDILYAIFKDTSVEHKADVLRRLEEKERENGGR